MIVYLNGKQYRLNPTDSIGKGGEADIFAKGNMAFKVFKQPNHPDFSGFPHEQQAAKIRIAEHQRKLSAFPKNLPNRVMAPHGLLTNKNGKEVLGYVMPFLKGCEVLLKYSDRSYRQAGVSNENVMKVFQDLHSTVKGVHKAGAIIGDFNDLNVMIKNSEAYIIDADSFQYGGFICHLFTERFVDPLLCDSSETHPILIKPHNENSDWYAYAIMLMQSLLFVGPYGGIYKPKNKSKRVKQAERPLRRITVFNSEVKYPKPAIHYDVLPDDMLQHFHLLFQEDKRGEYPEKLLNVRWTNCIKCGTIHAKRVCPGCKTYSPTAIKETIRGNVKCVRVFSTPGLIIYATIQDNNLKYLYHKENKFIRENEIEVIKGQISPTMRFRIRGKETLIGTNGQFVAVVPGRQTEKVAVDSLNLLPLFDSNNNHRYWAHDGQLFRSEMVGPKYIGNVLRGQTLFWVGSKFGFGFYRAGAINVGFVFNANKGGINDTIKMPVIPGQLIDATCYFADDWAWFFYSTREKGKTINRCMIIKSDGRVAESAEGVEGDGTWLGKIRGKAAAGNFLFAATDDGIARVEPSGGMLEVVKEFPDTESFVDSSCHLLVSKNGLYVVSKHEIRLLTIS
jgi:H/ACA ribonucleoprotein complex subunit 3